MFVHPSEVEGVKFSDFMGYYTSYSIRILNTDGSENDDYPLVIEAMRNVIENAKFGLTKEGKTNESITWYDHESDLAEWSAANPNILFELSGEGEDNDDIWRKYFLDGKMQVCKAVITFPAFDPSKLD